MTSIILDEPYTSDVVKPDGEPWPFALRLGPQTVLADTCADIITALTPAYADISLDTSTGREDALLFRWERAAERAGTIQAFIAADLANKGDFVPGSETDETLTAIFSDRMYPVDGVDHWEHVVPLVLVTTDYSPYNDRPAPTGHILWIDPMSELSFLKSLANIGFIDFHIHEDH